MTLNVILFGAMSFYVALETDGFNLQAADRLTLSTADAPTNNQGKKPCIHLPWTRGRGTSHSDDILSLWQHSTEAEYSGLQSFPSEADFLKWRLKYLFNNKFILLKCFKSVWKLRLHYYVFHFQIG